MSIYVVVEHDHQALKPCNYNVLSAALLLGTDIVAVVIGHSCDAVIAALSKCEAITKIISITNEVYEHFLPERYADALIAALDPLGGVSHVLMPATSFGKNLLPRVAALLGVTQFSDVIGIIDPVTFKRPIYAGNAIETLRTTGVSPILCTIRVSAFPQEKPGPARPTLVESLAFVSNNAQSKFVSREIHTSGRPELSSADIVIAGGRGLASKEAFLRLEKIADRLGAALGASRAAVDSGLVPNEAQVGQTGQVVAPKLYFAVGISGAIQHLAGMKASRVIVAINKDPEAPIFQVADYGLVADLNDVLPEWEKTLTEMGY